MKKALLATLLIFVFSRFGLAQDKPNIVFLFADDQTTSTLGCYGNEIIQTPNIDQLAKNGTRFENAFVSQSICWVSRTTILTGLVGRSYGTPDRPDKARPDAVAELYSDLLREAGYRTGYYGKWHAMMPAEFNEADHFDEFESISRTPYLKTMPDGSLRHETELIVDRGIKFIKSQPKDKPFALNLWFNACHAEDNDRRPGIGAFPWPQTVNGMYDDIDIPAPRLGDPQIFEALPNFLQTTVNRERFFWRWNTPEKYQTNVRAYYRMVSGLDREIGRFMEALKEAGLADNTIIVYSADNGYYMGNRGMAGKWSHYDESLRVPLIISDPRVPDAKQNQVVDSIALNVDFPATFLDWAGVKVPDRYQGHSLRPIVAGQTPDDWRVESFHEHFAVRHRIPAFEGIRNAGFKYVRYFDHDNHEFLHDLENDPDELINLATDPNYAHALKSMRDRTDRRVAEYGGALPPLAREFKPTTPPHPTATANVSHKQDKENFVELFNGNNLRGWTGDLKYWSVEDGLLTGTSDGTLMSNRFLSWKGSTIRNFDLRVQVKISAEGNSGIQYRSYSNLTSPDKRLDVVSGYQCDVVPKNLEYNGMLYEGDGRQILARHGQKVVIDAEGRSWITETMPEKKYEPDQWRQYRVQVIGNHHQHWIDDQLVVDVVDLDEENRSLEGILALQLHTGPAMTVQFKDFRIRHLPDDSALVDASQIEIPPEATGVRPIGKLPDNWKPPVYGER